MGGGRRKTGGARWITAASLATSSTQEMRRTRSQTLKEDQEIEIVETPKAPQRSRPVRQERQNEPSTGREGSHDSAISSESSKWSVSSSISIISRGLVNNATRRRCSGVERESLHPITESTINPQEAQVNGGNKVSADTLNWVNNLITSEIRSATPIIRSGTGNGHTIRQSTSRSTGESETDSGIESRPEEGLYFRSEILVHLAVVLTFAAMTSVNEYLKVFTKDLNMTPVTNPLAHVYIVYLTVGLISDYGSPALAILLPQVLIGVVCLITAVLPSEGLKDFLPIVRLLNPGILGSQLLAVNWAGTYNLEGLLARIGFGYGLTSVLCPPALAWSSQHLGTPLNTAVVVLASVLSMIAVIRRSFTKPRGQDKTSGECGWLHFIRFLVIKVCVTTQVALLLPLVQGLVQEDTAFGIVRLPVVMTLGMLCTQVVVAPMLRLFTSRFMAMRTVSVLLLLIYPALTLFDGSDLRLLILVVPLCGLVGVLQIIQLSAYLTVYPSKPGLILSTCLVIHMFIRQVVGEVSGVQESLAMVAGEWRVLMADYFSKYLAHWLPLDEVQAYTEFLPNLSIYNPLACDSNFDTCGNWQVKLVAVTGCIFSSILLISVQTMKPVLR